METKGIMYSNSITMCNVTFTDIALNPTCSIKLTIPSLGVLRLPISLYMVSKWPICSPHFFPEILGELCGVGALDGMTSYFPTNIPWKRIIFPSFYFLNFFLQVSFCDPLKWDVLFPSQGSPSSIHLY